MGIAKEKGKNECKCPACGAAVSGGRTLTEPVREPSERPESETGGSKKKKEHSEPGDDEFNTQPKSYPFSTWLAECDKTPDEPVTPGVKATAVKNKILQWQREAPDDKIISKQISHTYRRSTENGTNGMSYSLHAVGSHGPHPRPNLRQRRNQVSLFLRQHERSAEERRCQRIPREARDQDPGKLLPAAARLPRKVHRTDTPLHRLPAPNAAAKLST